MPIESRSDDVHNVIDRVDGSRSGRRARPRLVPDVVCPATVLAQGRVGESAQVAGLYPTGFGFLPLSVDFCMRASRNPTQKLRAGDVVA